MARLRLLRTLGDGVARGLPTASEAGDPLTLFRDWLAAAEAAGISLPEAAGLSTVAEDGAPSSRMVLLKHFDEHGFVFYTNYESSKARHLERNPRAALLFHWAPLQRQVRIEGAARMVQPQESEAYFRTRSRGSQLGAWASRQSELLASREALEASFREARTRFDGAEVPLPPFWGGYRLRPRLIEFWQGRLDRLHDRIAFAREGDVWAGRRLCP